MLNNHPVLHKLHLNTLRRYTGEYKLKKSHADLESDCFRWYQISKTQYTWTMFIVYG